ncbi:acylphosphatase-2 isoform X1 [Phasianus colchicus]|uniref:acylphosphatase-2 isoform X1 n=1 Tax=Phasianus colchicus TaxID=9054 RepID=UPI00129E9C61|nr:acylphosphatase-2 isoform X1 [Phasianus colchicus]
MSALTKASGALKSVDYEVFGRVQGVCFRMYTEEEARKLGVVGWVKNTRQGTVTGQVQGPEDKVNAIVWPPPNLSDVSVLLPLEKISCSNLNLPLCPDSAGEVDGYSTPHIQVSVCGEESEGFSVVRYDLFSWQCLALLLSFVVAVRRKAKQ